MPFNLRVLTCLMIAAAFAGPALAVDNLDFAVIQPGQPGTSQDAQPVMDALAAYIQKKAGPGTAVHGAYFNGLDPALEFMRQTPPRWGIVSLGFYAAYAGQFPMIPLAATRPGGFGTDVWRLVVGKAAPDSWQALQGSVQGTMLFETEAATRLLFGQNTDRLPFAVSGTFHPLRSLRAVTRGKVAGVVLDRRQYEAMQALPVSKKIKVVHVSKALPTGPVVWFGRPGEEMEYLAEIVKGMGDDPDAASLLRLLQTDGFGPVDAELLRLRMDANGGSSP